jgi:hypothetical protein
MIERSIPYVSSFLAFPFVFTLGCGQLAPRLSRFNRLAEPFNKACHDLE